MTISNKQKLALNLVFKDVAGAVATVSGTPTWNSSDTNIAVLVTAADGLSTSVESVTDAIGSTTVTATLGALTASLVVDVNADGGVGTATTLEIVVGPVTNK